MTLSPGEEVTDLGKLGLDRAYHHVIVVDAGGLREDAYSHIFFCQGYGVKIAVHAADYAGLGVY